MATSEARINANRQNSAKSTGPKTEEGKDASRRNSFKHGLTGAGIVLPNEDLAEVERRLSSYRDELQPSGEVGESLVRRAAVLSVRLDRCVSHETATLSGRIRQADADFVAPEGADAATAHQLRAEAKARAMFDPSKEATLARRYEAAAERGFFRTIKELRLLEKQRQATRQGVAPDGFREMLASFSQFDDQCESFEADHFPEELRTFANPTKRPQHTPIASRESYAEIPFTVGRRS